MADGELTLNLDEETARRLKEAADAAGRSVPDYAQGLIADALDADWAEDLDRIAEYERTGESLFVEETLAFFDSELEKRLAARR